MSFELDGVLEHVADSHLSPTNNGQREREHRDDWDISSLGEL